jgi:ribosomal protein uS2
MDIDAIISRLEAAGRFIAREGQNEQTLILYATEARFENALKSFHRATLLPTIYKRFRPGTLTNAKLSDYVDASVLIVSDPTNGVPRKQGQAPTGDCRAMQEASKEGIPVVAICDTNATFDNVDFCIPGNNYGVRSTATIFYLLARSVLLASGTQAPDRELRSYIKDEPLTIEDFETVLVEEAKEE